MLTICILGVPESSSFNSSGRAYPDVAAVSVDGTSQSCPTVAGILSLVIDYRKSQGAYNDANHLVPYLILWRELLSVYNYEMMHICTQINNYV